jgi:hypothetical protein
VAEAEDDQARHYRSAAAHGLFGIYCVANDAHVGRLDEALAAYDSFAGAAPPGELRVASPPELSTFCLFDGIPGARNTPADLAKAAAGGSWHEPATALTIDLASIRSLANFAATAGFRGAAIEIDKPEESGHWLMRRRSYGSFKLRVALDSQTTIPSNRLSFGQKRLFAFYWYLACIPEGVVLADELASGFHRSWIAACLDQIGDRQAILASQNPLLLDLLTFDDAEQVRRSFVLCSLEGNEAGGRPWNWQNMSPDSAGEFFRSYEAGLQHVSEILRVGGWW